MGPRSMRSARCALDHLHGQEVRGVGLLEAVDGGDVGVVERRQHPRFALEGRQPFGVGGDVLRQHLDRNVAPELGVARAIHHTHPSRTQGRAIVRGSLHAPARAAHLEAGGSVFSVAGGAGASASPR
jgi:hypothetical protein